MDKQKIREKIKDLIQNLSSNQREIKSNKIWEELSQLPEFIQAKTVMFYIAMQDEVDTHSMIDKAIQLGKQVVVPVVSSKKDKELMISILFDRNKDLECGPWGILQPKEESLRSIAPEKIDLVVVPGVAFDNSGNRLGRGKGYYDRFLSRLPQSVISIGIAFDFQIINPLPITSFDVPVTKVLVA